MTNEQRDKFGKIFRYLLVGIVFIFIIYAAFLPSYAKFRERERRGTIDRIEYHFNQLEAEGFEVIYDLKFWNGKVNKGAGTLVTSETHTWKVKENAESEWIEYIWELHPINDETLSILESRGIPTDGWWRSQEGITPQGVKFQRSFQGSLTILLPMSPSALEYHLAQSIRLPENYSLE